MFFIIGPLGLSGCTLISGTRPVDGYTTQKRIVWQGTLTVDHGADIVRLIYFGYDRNGDFKRLTPRTACRGIDVLEYKCLLPNGHWDFKAFLVIVDDDYDCYAERALYDCDGDGILEKTRDIADRHFPLEDAGLSHRGLFEPACLDSRRP